jgi:STE24 endopeptidase
VNPKPTALFLALAFLTLSLVTLLARSPDMEARAARYFTREEIERGRRHAFERRLIFWTGQAVQLAFLMALVLSGLARRLADACERWAGGRWVLTLLLVAAICFLAEALLSFPISLYGGLYHQRAWGLTERSLASWLADYAKAIAVSAVIGAALLVGFYALVRWLPRSWWIVATLASAGVGVFFALVWPVLIAPLFNTFVPLENTPHAGLRPRIEAMAARARLGVREVLVMDASRQSRHTNAYFAGFGPTRRIVLYDTLVKSHPVEEVESILGHEIGHWRHGHIAKGVALGAAGSLLGLFVLSRILEWAVGRPPFHLRSPADPAGFPLILLLSFLGSWLAMPVASAVSRHFERQADEASLELGGRPDVFVEAEKRLARDNIGNVAPARFNVWLFASHPPAVERIERAEAWKAAQPAR